MTLPVEHDKRRAETWAEGPVVRKTKLTEHFLLAECVLAHETFCNIPVCSYAKKAEAKGYATALIDMLALASGRTTQQVRDEVYAHFVARKQQQRLGGHLKVAR